MMRKWDEGRNDLNADEPTPKKLAVAASRYAEPPRSRHGHRTAPPPDLPTPPPTVGTMATPDRCPTRVTQRAPSVRAVGQHHRYHAPPAGPSARSLRFQLEVVRDN
ncbi:hypothetical protein ZWY2020_015913 [Hordeum vulgare]|nr:hypothetical protein ZWY2020_015913 [Hordeum vulgare]